MHSCCEIGVLTVWRHDKPKIKTTQERNVRGMTPDKWKSMRGLTVFPSIQYIILTEHQLNAGFWPDEIIKSGWDLHAVAGTVTTLPQQGYRRQRYREGLALLMRNTMWFSTTMKLLSGVLDKITGVNCTSLGTRGDGRSR